MNAYTPPCTCCGVCDYVGPSTFYKADETYVCGMCRRRQRLCQHNLPSRVLAGGRNAAYSSRTEPVLVVYTEGEVKRCAVVD